jgi:hypothetical protein
MAVATQNNLSFEEYEYGINMIKEYIKDWNDYLQKENYNAHS